MSSVSGIGYDNYSSGLAVESAADNPAAVGIIEGMENQERGYDVATDNAESAQDMIDTADSALATISDTLSQIRELAVQASNTATLSDDDIAAIQDEIDQLKQSIEDTAKGTNYNQISLLDDDTTTYNLATNPDGSGSSIQFVNSTLESLGIADFDVTEDFDISTIDDAIEQVSSSRSDLGATYNGLDSTISTNTIASENLVSSRSSLEDLDYAEASVEINKKKIIEQYQVFLQKKLTEDEEQRKLTMFT